jgi:hypothetical protein
MKAVRIQVVSLYRVKTVPGHDHRAAGGTRKRSHASMVQTGAGKAAAMAGVPGCHCVGAPWWPWVGRAGGQRGRSLRGGTTPGEDANTRARGGAKASGAGATAVPVRPIRRAGWRPVKVGRATPAVVMGWLPGAARKAAATGAGVPATRRRVPGRRRLGARSFTTTASPKAGGGERRGVGPRPRVPCGGGVAHTPSPAQQVSASGGRASRGKPGRAPAGAACRRHTRQRASRPVRFPTPQARTRGPTGLLARPLQAAPALAARVSSGVTGAAGVAPHGHHASPGPSRRGTERQPAGRRRWEGGPTTGRHCLTGAGSTAHRRRGARMRRPGARAPAPRRAGVLAVRIPA